MICQHLDSLSSPVAATQQQKSIYRDECTQCFESKDIWVCLDCFNGSCFSHALNHFAACNSAPEHGRCLRIQRKRRPPPPSDQNSTDPPPLKKVVIHEQPDPSTQFDSTYSLACLVCCSASSALPSSVPCLDDQDVRTKAWVQRIVHSTPSAQQQSEMKQWEEQVTMCEHTLCLTQEPPPAEQRDLSHCGDCTLKENLWLCLTCGNIGCGRRQFDGSGGNNHGSEHYNKTRHPCSVKLGTITAEGTADVYCYECDDMKLDSELKAHLSTFGIHLAEQQKTVKSMAELQLEQNLKFDFNMKTADGSTMTPLFGPGLTGMKNIGNSCYIASVLQSLFSIPVVTERYLKFPMNPREPAKDYATQMHKLADGLCSGRYSVPDDLPLVQAHTDGEAPAVQFQAGIPPRMLKDVIGRGHPDFSTMQQQDAFEFLQFLLQKTAEWEKNLSNIPLEDYFSFKAVQRLQCTQCQKVRYSDVVAESIEVPVPAHPLPTPQTDVKSEKDQGVQYASVSLDTCLEAFAAQDAIDGFKCPGCQGQETHATRQLRFGTFPPVLVMHLQRFVLENWVPKKLNVPVTMKSGQLDASRWKSQGLLPTETPMPEEPKEAAGNEPQVDPTSLEQLMGMGFSKNRSIRALLATDQQGAEVAMEWLFSKMDDASLDAPFEAPAASSATNVPDDLIQNIVEMGFTVKQAKKALLKTKLNIEQAIEWLFNHPEDDGTLEETTAPSSNSTNSAASRLLTDLSGQYVLQAIVSHKGTSTHCGHYVAYIRRPDGKYALFNDEKVVDAGDIFQQQSPSDGASMGYVYFWLNKDYFKI